MLAPYMASVQMRFYAQDRQSNVKTESALFVYILLMVLTVTLTAESYRKTQTEGLWTKGY